MTSLGADRIDSLPVGLAGLAEAATGIHGPKARYFPCRTAIVSASFTRCWAWRIEA